MAGHEAFEGKMDMGGDKGGGANLGGGDMGAFAQASKGMFDQAMKTVENLFPKGSDILGPNASKT